MGLLLAPFNNAMRLGQGYNSYTQEICVDDAVIIDPARPMNTITNDGSTMADVRARLEGPAAYKAIDRLTEPTLLDKRPITGDVTDVEDAEPENNDVPDEDDEKTPPTTDDDHHEEKAVSTKAAAKPIASTSKTQAAADEEKEAEEDEEESEEEEQDEEEDEEEDKDTTVKKPPPKELTEKEKENKKREEQMARDRAAAKKAAEEKAKKDAEDDKQRSLQREKAEKEAEARRKDAEERARKAAVLKPYTKEERDAWLDKNKNADGSDKVIVKRPGTDTSPIVTDGTKYVYNPAGGSGPAQIVTYSSRFIDKLSDITDDMNISGALSIKYGAIGGSGRGAFVNSDKFHESDLNFYISVKVINQTTNLKDALVYQPLRSVNATNFREVYGDCFISGFLEGGEFNALVSMKVLNKANMTKIEAEAKVALTVGAAAVEAEAAVKIAKQNISNNTETTIQVSWSGGGYIKPIDELWTVDTLTAAAARFPDLVAKTPQRTYAILTKYDSLRSFVKLKPAAYSAMQYESAQLYTNMLMDTYMDYKAILKRLSAEIFDVENGISHFEQKTATPKSSAKDAKFDPKNLMDETPFEATLGGLDKARRAARFQMVRIVNEVDEITKDPKKATDEDRIEPFQAPRVFKDRCPTVRPNIAAPANPLSNEYIAPGSGRGTGELCPEFQDLEDPERLALTELMSERPTLGRYFRLTKPVGYWKKGDAFNNLDFLKYGVRLSGIRVGMVRGAVTALQMQYNNGLLVKLGGEYENTVWSKELTTLASDEKIIACSIETGEEVKPGENDEKSKPAPGSTLTAPPDEDRITRLKLYTNRGRMLAAQPASLDERNLRKIDTRDGRKFRNLTIKHYDQAMEKAYIKGFWGYSSNGAYGADDDGLWRLGVVWGNDLIPELPPPPPEGLTDKKKEKPKGKEAKKDT